MDLAGFALEMFPDFGKKLTLPSPDLPYGLIQWPKVPL